jgi:GT2 family glycosyltransferase
VDWVAGMFLLIRTEAFRALGGFDEGFHLYYEDVDFCARAWKAGWKVQVHPEVSVIHDAQRAEPAQPPLHVLARGQHGALFREAPGSVEARFELTAGLFIP